MKSLLLCCGLALAACATPRVVREQVRDEVVVEQEPPAIREEIITVAPSPGHVWVRGHWRWEGAWVWAPGSWQAPRAGYRWVHGEWRRHPRGWAWVEGRWVL
jgi:WXXGXW repeat (2 copies)